jgi:Mce-associated membrane protein
MSSNPTSSPTKVALEKGPVSDTSTVLEKDLDSDTFSESEAVADSEVVTTSGTGVDGAGEGSMETAVSGADDQVVAEQPGRLQRTMSWAGRRWGAVLITFLLVASAGATGAVYWWIYRPDQLTNAAAQQQVLDAAKQGTTSLLSYAPESLDKDLATAKSHLTGEFLKYYSDFTDQIVAPAARSKGVKTEATIVRAAVSEMHPDRAVVLVFVNQVTTSKDRPEPALATSSVMVTMDKSDGRWLISEFKPV